MHVHFLSANLVLSKFYLHEVFSLITFIHVLLDFTAEYNYSENYKPQNDEKGKLKTFWAVNTIVLPVNVSLPERLAGSVNNIALTVRTHSSYSHFSYRNRNQQICSGNVVVYPLNEERAG